MISRFDSSSDEDNCVSEQIEVEAQVESSPREEEPKPENDEIESSPTREEEPGNNESESDDDCEIEAEKEKEEEDEEMMNVLSDNESLVSSSGTGTRPVSQLRGRLVDVTISDDEELAAAVPLDQEDQEDRASDTEVAQQQDITSIDDFLTENSDSLKKIAGSQYSSNKPTAKDPVLNAQQNICNIIATAERITEKGKGTRGQELYREKVVKRYKEMRDDNFSNLEEVETLMERALNNMRSDDQKQRSLLSFFAPKKAASTTASTTASTSAVSITSSASTSKVTSQPSVTPGAVFMLGAQLMYYKPQADQQFLKKILDEKNKQVKTYQEVRDEYVRRSTKMIVKNTNKEKIEQADKAIMELVQLLSNAEEISRVACVQTARSRNLAENAETMSVAAAKVKEIEKLLRKKTLELDVTKLTQELRTFNNKRNYDQRRTVLKNRSRIVNANRTWTECLNDIENEVPDHKGVKMSHIDARKVLMAMRENPEGYVEPGDLPAIMNRAASEEKCLTELVVNHLSVVEVTMDGRTRIYDARTFLKDPELLVDLYLKDQRFEGVKKRRKTSDNKEEVLVNVARAPVSGRPRGSYRLKEDVVREVKQFIDSAGTPAHAR